MAIKKTVKVGEYGFDFPLQFVDDAGLPLDLTGVTDADALRLEKPGDAGSVDVAIVVDDASNGLAHFTVPDPSFFDLKGVWYARGRADFSGTRGRLSDPVAIDVDADLPAPTP
jgi:hypothetical protein